MSNLSLGSNADTIAPKTKLKKTILATEKVDPGRVTMYLLRPIILSELAIIYLDNMLELFINGYIKFIYNI